MKDSWVIPSAEVDVLRQGLLAVANTTHLGRPLFAGLRSLGLPGHPLGDAWRLADMLREYRGDGHIAVLLAHRVTAPDALLMQSPWLEVRSDAPFDPTSCVRYRNRPANGPAPM